MENGNVITVNAGAALTVLDSTSTETSPGTGKITGGNDKTNANYEDVGGGVFVNGGALTLLGGAISGNHADNGGGVHVENGGTFTLSGGGIVENTASKGGGVYVNEGTFEMSGDARISQNNAYLLEQSYEWGRGGGAYISHGNFEITGGTIGDNMATEGGGLYITNGGDGTYTHAISNVTIKDNKAIIFGGGIVLEEGATTLSGSVRITGNGPQANREGNKVLLGGGVFVEESTLEMVGDVAINGNTAATGGGVCVYSDGASKNRLIVSGAEKVNGGETQIVSPKVTGNKDLSDNNSNVYLFTGRVIEIAGALGEAALIGVRMEKPGAFTRGLKGLSDDPKGALGNFADDAEVYDIGFDADGEAALMTDWGALQVLIDVAANAADDDPAKTVTLQKDYTANADLGDGALVIPAGKSVILDLNGHTIDRGLAGKDAVVGGNVITVNAGAALTVRDKTSTETSPGTGKITGGNDKKNASQEYAGGGVFVDGGALTLLGGAISGNHAYYGGGVNVENGGTFTLSGGEIVENTALYNGGGVYVTQSTFEMSGDARIAQNTAYLRTQSNEWGYGGGAYIGNCNFDIKGGTISDNMATEGGGLFIANGGGGTYTHAISNATIANNKAIAYGGGIEVLLGIVTLTDGVSITGNGPQANREGKEVLEGGGVDVSDGTLETVGDVAITGNTAAKGGGVCVYYSNNAVDYGVLSVSGAEKENDGKKEIVAPKVTGNKNLSDDADDVYLYAGAVIDVAGKLGPASIGVGMETPGAFTRGLKGLADDPNGAASNFTSDDALLIAAVNDGGEAYLTSGWSWLQGEMRQGHEVTLWQDVVCDDQNKGPLVVPAGVTTAKLDLNGHTVDRGLAGGEAVVGGNVITVNAGAALTVLDSTSTETSPGTGKITGGNDKMNANYEDVGGGVFVDGGALTLLGGAISGNHAYYGGGVHVENGGTFTLSGGEIVENTARNGGGVYVNEGTFEMSGDARIAQNTAYLRDQSNEWGCGGGVCIFYSNFEITGGTISDNMATEGGGLFIINGGGGTYTHAISNATIANNKDVDYGGGIALEGGTTTLSDGVRITGNGPQANREGKEVLEGGGVYIKTGCTLETVGDVVISGNTAAKGGGVCVYAEGASKSRLIVSGAEKVNGGETQIVAPKVTGNKDLSDNNSNVYLCTGTVIEIPDALGEASIGVTTQTAPTQTDPVVITSGLKDKGGAESFTSDDDTYVVARNAAGEVVLGTPVQMPTIDTNTPHGKVELVAISGQTPTGNGIVVCGEILTLKVTAEAGFELKPGTVCAVYDVNGAPQTVLAEEDPKAPGTWYLTMPGADGVVIKAEFVTPWAALQALIDAAAEKTDPDDRVVTLQKNYRADASLGDTTPLMVAANKEVTIDLNGFTIDRGLAEADAVDGGNVITVNGALTVTDGSKDGTGAITGGNNSGNGGGVYVEAGTFTFSGGAIVGNSAGYGGGVYVCYDSAQDHGTLKVSGKASITDNADLDGNASNVYLPGNAKIDIAGALDEKTAIGVGMEAPGAFTSGLKGKDTNPNGTTGNFPSDDYDYLTVIDGQGEAALISAWRWVQGELAKGGTVTLEKDIRCIDQDDGPLVVPAGVSSGIDLNGHTIDRGLSKANAVEDGHVITVKGELKVHDATGMSDVITGGNSTGNGGGIRVDGGALEVYDGVTISGNSAANGGGAYVRNGTLEMADDAKITENSAATGGGVYVHSDDQYKGALSVSGLTEVDANVNLDGKASNVYLSDDAVIDIADALDDSAVFGVTTETAPTKGDPVVLTDGLKGKGSVGQFTSDVSDAGYAVVETAMGEAMLCVPLAVSFDTYQHGEVNLIAISGQEPTGNDIVICNDILTLEVKPAVGWRLAADGLKAEYEDANGQQAVIATENTDPGEEGTYDITMPGADVTITAAFELIPAAEPVIDGEPALEGAAALTYGEAGSLSIGAQTGSDQVLSYQWYSCDSEGGDAKAIEGATGAVCDLSARMDAGTYYFLCDVTATRNDNGEKNTKRSGVVKVTVQPKTLEVYAEPRSKIEGEKDPALTYSVYGLVGADRLSGALTRESGELPGTYAITQGTLAASANYAVSYIGANFVIGVKPSLNFNGDITQVATVSTVGNDTLAYAWSSVPGAEGYDLYFKKCDGKGGYQLIETLDGAALLNSQVTGLKKGTAYKAYIMAWRKEAGQKVYIGKASPYVHAIAGGFNKKKKICNARLVKVKKPEITLAVGKKSKIKASVKPIKRGYNVLRHVSRLRYFSSDRNVAVVNKRGKITAVGVGTCTIYVVANNGVYKEVTVTVTN